jgi:hypothetical protein
MQNNEQASSRAAALPHSGWLVWAKEIRFA